MKLSSNSRKFSYELLLFITFVSFLGVATVATSPHGPVRSGPLGPNFCARPVMASEQRQPTGDPASCDNQLQIAIIHQQFFIIVHYCSLLFIIVHYCSLLFIIDHYWNWSLLKLFIIDHWNLQMWLHVFTVRRQLIHLVLFCAKKTRCPLEDSPLSQVHLSIVDTVDGWIRANMEAAIRPRPNRFSSVRRCLVLNVERCVFTVWASAGVGKYGICSFILHI